MKYFFILLSFVFLFSSFIMAGKNREQDLFLVTMSSVFYGIYAILDKIDKLNKK